MAPEVLRNPASTMQEGPAVLMNALDVRNIKPYDEKVRVRAGQGCYFHSELNSGWLNSMVVANQ